MAKLLYSILSVVVLGLVWFLISPLFIVLEKHDPMPGGEENVVPGQPLFVPSAQGEFVAGLHEVKGKAVLGRTHRGDIVLRFEDFETINGPDVRIYISSSKDSVDDALDLGPIQGTKGNINYQLERDIDVAIYPYVLVWCRAFRVLFSVAELKPV